MAIEMQYLAMEDNSEIYNDNGNIRSKAKKSTDKNHKKVHDEKPIFVCAVCKMGYVRRMR